MNTKMPVLNYSRTQLLQMVIIIAFMFVIALISFFLPIILATGPVRGS